MAERLLVVKVGSSSLAPGGTAVSAELLDSLAAQLSRLRDTGTRAVVVTSGAVATGLGALGIAQRPTELAVLQAASAVGQHRVMRAWQDALDAVGITCGQVLLDPADFFTRRAYLLAQRTFSALLELGVLPVVNENDAVADQELRFGDNDRLAALVAVLVKADRLVLLTDTAGLFTADPQLDEHATLIDEVIEIDRALEAAAGGAGSALGTGGMASKLAAARLATWSGIEAVVADARAERIVERLESDAGATATVFRARARPLAARKAWLAFATVPRGRVEVDAGARRALLGGASLLLAGITELRGAFLAGDAVEVTCDGALVAKGLARLGSGELDGLRAGGAAPRDVVCVHRDDLVVVAERSGGVGTVER